MNELAEIEEYEDLIAWNESYGISKKETINELKLIGVSKKIISYLNIYG